MRDSCGVLLGAIGVSGDLSDMDERCAVYAVDAVGLVPEPGIDTLLLS